MRKREVILLVAALAVVAAGCGSRPENGTEELPGGYGTEKTDGDSTQGQNTENGPAGTEKEEDGSGLAGVRVGVITGSGDERDAEREAHLAGISRMAEHFGLTGDQVLQKSAGAAERETSCYDAAVELAEAGCDVIFSCILSEEELLRAAIEYPAVEFCQAKGTMAPEAGVANLHNYGLSFYEAFYVSGIVAGHVLNDTAASGAVPGGEIKLGYVAARPEAADISGFTAFYLGVRNSCPEAVMEVSYTGGSDDAAADKAGELIENGCVLIGCNTGMDEVAAVCGARGIPYVGETIDRYADVKGGADGALVYPAADWGRYYSYAVERAAEGGYIDTDWCRGYADEAVGIDIPKEGDIPPESAEQIKKAEEALKNGSLPVFDTDTFTIDGQTLETCIAQGGGYEKYRLYVYDGFFHESEYGSAPVFDLIVDGIRVR